MRIIDLSRKNISGEAVIRCLNCGYVDRVSVFRESSFEKKFGSCPKCKSLAVELLGEPEDDKES